MMQEDFALRVRANQEQLSANLGGEFDFTGVRGQNVRFRCCRKTRGESSSEGLLLEAGGSDELEWSRIPNFNR